MLHSVGSFDHVQTQYVGDPDGVSIHRDHVVHADGFKRSRRGFGKLGFLFLVESAVYLL